MRNSKHKALLAIVFGVLLIVGMVALYWWQRGDALLVQPTVNEHTTNESLQLPVPSAPLSDWYLHRQSDSQIIFTRDEELPDIGATEGYAYGEQINASVIPFDGETTQPEDWQQISWINDEALVRETEWTSFSDFTVLRVRHAAGGASGEQLTFYLFAHDRVYNLSLYPVDEVNEREFIGFMYQYADQLREVVLDASGVEPNSFRWGCPNDYQFRITYSGEGNGDALLELPAEDPEQLIRARSGSGARYTNSDESVIFWEHQGEAMVEVDGEIVRERCVVESRSVR